MKKYVKKNESKLSAPSPPSLPPKFYPSRRLCTLTTCLYILVRIIFKERHLEQPV